MAHKYTSDEIYELTSIFANEPFDYEFEKGGHVEYMLRENRIDDPTLKRLIARYIAASKSLKKYLRELGVGEI